MEFKKFQVESNRGVMGSLVSVVRALTLILDTHSASSCTSINYSVTQAHWCGELYLEKIGVG